MMSDLQTEIHNLFVQMAPHAPGKLALFHEFVKEQELDETLYSWLCARMRNRHENLEAVGDEAIDRLEGEFVGKWSKHTNVGGDLLTLRCMPNPALHIELTYVDENYWGDLPKFVWHWRMKLEIADVQTHGTASDPVEAAREALRSSLPHMNDHRRKITQHLEDLDEIEELCSQSEKG